MTDEELTKLIRRYDAGYQTDGEVLRALVQAAAVRRPEELAALVPEPWLGRLRAAAAEPPDSVESCPWRLVVGSVGGPPPTYDDQRAASLAGRRRWYAGIWSWHRFFGGA